jgi:predicted ferric reductase
MTRALQKLNLTAHVTSSVGWLGAVASFLVLSIAGLTSQNTEIVRGAYLAMNLIGQFIIVPLSLAALLTGLVQSLGSHWGLFRHYWVVVKFTLTIGATLLLLLHQFTAVAGAARRVSGTATGTLPEPGGLGVQLVSDAGLAVLALLVITVLSVYKPWGRTRYGLRKQPQERRELPGGTALSTPPVLSDPRKEPAVDGLPVGLRIFLAVVGVIVAGFAMLHLGGGGHRH